MLIKSTSIKRSRLWFICTGLTAISAIQVQAAEATKTQIELVSHKKAAAIIVYNNDSPVYSLTANKLASYIRSQTDVGLQTVTDVDFKPKAKVATILLDGATDKSLLKKYGLTATVKSSRHDAYSIQTLWHNSMAFIVLAGNSPDAVKFAAYRLMEELDIQKGNASVKPLDIQAEPFFKNRLVSMGNIWRTAIEIERKYNIEAWPVDRIVKSVDMYDSFGFNGFEVLDRFNEGYLMPCYGITREQWRNKVWAIADRAHLNGQKVYLRAWGNAVMDIPEGFKAEGPTSNVPRIFKTFCPDLPEDRKRWEEEIRDYYVPNYASHIDNFIGHWADAGGCRDPKSQATIDDCLRLHMELQSAFRKVNPDIQTSFSFWHMDANNWRQYKDHHSVSASPILSKDVIMTQATRSHTIPYSEKLTSDFIADGHPAATWTWIRGDAESFHNDASLLIRVHSLGKYFSGLPASAQALDWHNVERCQHGMANVVNYYVAGKLMWDPKADVDKLLKDFAVKMFGQKNAPTIVEAYNTMEKVRVSDNMDKKPAPKNPSEVAQLCHNALRKLNNMKIEAGYRPRLGLVITPQQIRRDLIDALTVIEEYALCYSRELPELDNAIKEKNKDAEDKLINSLKNKISNWGSSIAGLFEARAMEQQLQKRGYQIGA
ncbi:MAG: hypothetical protein K0S09_344 [Sphingobacteriaceae bacterium]|jgi:hypothetical protein|nr:hypothetical protein [Sphingobacteriaceae bacterium]